jgi:hypothetical protein
MNLTENGEAGIGFLFSGFGPLTSLCVSNSHYLFIYSLAVLDSYIEQLVIETNGS